MINAGTTDAAPPGGAKVTMTGNSTRMSNALLIVRPIPRLNTVPPVEPYSDCILPPPGRSAPKLSSVGLLSSHSTFMLPSPIPATKNSLGLPGE